MNKLASTKKRLIGITLGDPAGVGPEVLAKAVDVLHFSQKEEILIIGDKNVFRKFCLKLPQNCALLDLNLLSSNDCKSGKGTGKTALASLEYLKIAVQLIKDGTISALVTGPVHKEHITALGNHFSGHTEFLAEAFGIKHVEMMFIGERLKTLVATRHIPLNKVSRALTIPGLIRTFHLAADSLKNHFKIPEPKIAVCGLNPHAGEGGHIGKEELETISPAIEKGKKDGLDINGPFAADTIFTPDNFLKYDLIIAMYHDQGLIAVKSLYFHELVNMTAGLPFIRTSPAHGTAFNIAGQNIAHPGSMIAAIRLAKNLLKRQS